MSIALERGAGIGGSGFIRVMVCVPIYDSPEIGKEERRMDPPPLPLEDSPASSLSSIGRDSDAAGREEEEDEGGEMGEVQSAYKGTMQGIVESLEGSLPIRRGISNFYAGNSKSFASLSDAVASCASSKDLGKPENAYTRRRRNLLASKTVWERPHSSPLRSSGCGIAKKPCTPSRSTLALAVAMSSSAKHCTGSSEDEQDDPQFLPPLHPPGKSITAVASPVSSSSPQRSSFPMRSFSLGDLPVFTCPGSPI